MRLRTVRRLAAYGLVTALLGHPALSVQMQTLEQVLAKSELVVRGKVVRRTRVQLPSGRRTSAWEVEVCSALRGRPRAARTAVGGDELTVVRTPALPRTPGSRGHREITEKEGIWFFSAIENTLSDTYQLQAWHSIGQLARVRQALESAGQQKAGREGPSRAQDGRR